MWLASPSSSGSIYMMDVNYRGAVSNGNLPGLRPVVCLKSDVHLEQKDDGTYEIVDNSSTNPQTGAIKFSNLQWDSSYTTASVTVTKTTSDTLDLQYKVNDDEWKTVDNGYTITGLKDGDLVTACLYDGSNRGYYATLNVQGDKTAPTATIQFNKTTAEPDEEITATVTVTDSQSGVASAKYEFNTVNTEIGTDEASYTETISGDTVTLSSSEAGTYYLHILTIDKAGNKGETISEAVIIQIPGDTAEDVASNPNQYYGQYVAYQPSNNANVRWKIFYADTKNIYLIADDYISSSYVPNGKGGTTINGNSYKVWFTNVISDYSGSSDITNSLAKSWLSYLNSYPNDTNNNMKAVAYMLDTNVWNTFTDSAGKAEYAIGGPTLDLFCASYNQKYPTKTIQYRASNNGYEVKWSSDSSYSTSIGNLPTNDSLYVIHDANKAGAMWLASPSALGNNYLKGVAITGFVSNNNYDNSNAYGVRPVVCLKPGTQLDQQVDGTYKLK